MKYKRLAVFALTLTMTMSLAACGSNTTAPATESGAESTQPAAAEETKSPVKIQISTASTSGSFYQEGLAFAQTVSNHSDTLEVSAVTSAGSNENVSLLRNGETSIGCVQRDVLLMQLTAQAPLKPTVPLRI